MFLIISSLKIRHCGTKLGDGRWWLKELLSVLVTQPLPNKDNWKRKCVNLVMYENWVHWKWWWLWWWWWWWWLRWWCRWLAIPVNKQRGIGPQSAPLEVTFPWVRKLDMKSPVKDDHHHHHLYHDDDDHHWWYHVEEQHPWSPMMVNYMRRNTISAMNVINISTRSLCFSQIWLTGQIVRLAMVIAGDRGVLLLD